MTTTLEVVKMNSDLQMFASGGGKRGRRKERTGPIVCGGVLGECTKPAIMPLMRGVLQ